MKIVVHATTEEKLGLVYLALCSQLPYFVNYGYQLQINDDHYEAAENALKAVTPKGKRKDICLEDVQTQMLRMGYGLRFKGYDEAKTATLTLKKIERNWKKVPANLVLRFTQERYDAGDSDLLMQWLLLGDIVYG